MAEQAGLNLTLSKTPKTGFLVTRPNFDSETSSEPKWAISDITNQKISLKSPQPVLEQSDILKGTGKDI